MGMLYTVKLVRRCPAQRNRPDVIVDECGFNIWTARSQGRALRGERAYRQVAGQRGNNITITLAVSSTFGLIHHSMHIGGTNQGRFQAFLQESAENLPENETTIIFDGTPSPGTNSRGTYWTANSSSVFTIFKYSWKYYKCIKSGYNGRYFMTHGSTADEWQACLNGEFEKDNLTL